MAQGKLKVKAKLPANAKKNKQSKGNGATQKTNRPIQPKKAKNKDAQKFKQIITKNVNKAVEEEIRSRAFENKKSNLSKAQQAVAAHHNNKKSNAQQ